MNETDILLGPRDNSLNEVVVYPHNSLLEAVLSNSSNRIANIVNSSTLNSIKEGYLKHHGKNIVAIACSENDVTPQTLDDLCGHLKHRYGDQEYSNEDFYDWEPLHYLAKTANPEKLEVFIKHVDNVDQLTFFSENALHILLTYSVQPFQVVLSNGSKSKPFSIIGREEDNIVSCAEILINSGIDVNHANFWNETPISLAARYRYSKIVDMLLKSPSIDLDNTREAGKSIRIYLKQHNICSSALLSQPSNYYQEDDVQILFGFLKSGDEKSFLQYNNENIKDYSNCLDRSGNNTCGTMLQFCFWKGFIEYVKSESYIEDLSKTDIMSTPMLEIFCSKGLKRCIYHLLNNNADPKLTDSKHKDTILEAASVRGYYPLVAVLLLHKKNQITVDAIFQMLPKLFFNTRANFLRNHDIYRNHLLYLFLNKLISLHRNKGTRLEDERLAVLNEVVHHLNLEMNERDTDDRELICQILSLGLSLTHGRKEDRRKQLIIERLHPSILRSHFDDCIRNGFNCNSIIEDYSSVKADGTVVHFYSETRTLQYLINDPMKEELILHPLIVLLILSKWKRVRWLYYADLVFYASYFISICSYMIFSHVGFVSLFINYFLYSLLFLQFFKEMIQLFFLFRLKYFSDISNYAELSIIGFTIATILIPNVYARVISILLSTVMLFLMLSQMPTFTKYTLIFGSTKYFLQYFGFYSIQFIAFAICFYIVFETGDTTDKAKGNYNFTSITADFSKTLFLSLVRFTGQLDDPVIDPVEYPVFGRILTSTFIFFMTIILNNLLVGLIVSDINDIQEEARFHKHVKMAGFIIKTNSIIRRLQNFKSLNFVNSIHIFEKGKNKDLSSSRYQDSKWMHNDYNRDYLKSIMNIEAYDRHLFQKVFDFISENDVAEKNDNEAGS
ncbi:unnamed protein product [Callosobruchus maculatus]|uniref:Uncharacterized protein n=1 Tax=Callosobruchus maculatus TaxID=64391 RepID=A0A653C257_CALMS|nr:unnamed protein product [Callosobruchus maculatus]